MWPRGWSHFRPEGYNLNKLGRGPLGEAEYQNFNSLGLLVSDKKIFSRFPYISLCKTIDRGGAIFGPGAIIWTNFVEVH